MPARYQFLIEAINEAAVQRDLVRNNGNRTLNRNQRENGEKPVAAETVPDQKASGRSIPRYNVYRTRSEIGLRFLRDLVHQLALY